jgi:stage II sporulation protein R
MRKFINILATVLLVLLSFIIYDACKEKQFLQDHIVRLHVVANSDSEEDQEIKLIVKDAVAATVQEIQSGLMGKNEVLSALRESLPLVESVANNTLASLGVSDRVQVSLEKEEFDTRVYDTFTLPAGVYDALRVVIGDGEGKNWWCVAFPSLCIPASSKDFSATATGAGFSQSITNTISNPKQYQVRFFLLDCIGKLENLFR